MKKNNINLIVDIIMLTAMSAIAGIGLLLKYVLIAGKDRSSIYGRDVDLYLWGWDRHEWGGLHLWFGYALLALVVLHIILHWKQICLIASGFIVHKITRYVSAVLCAIFCAMLALWPFFISIEVKERARGSHSKVETIKEPKSAVVAGSDNNDRTIRGSMSLKEVSHQSKVPIEYLRKKLQLPLDVDENEKIGRLQQRYDVDMHKVREAIAQYNLESADKSK